MKLEARYREKEEEMEDLKEELANAKTASSDVDEIHEGIEQARVELSIEKPFLNIEFNSD